MLNLIIRELNRIKNNQLIEGLNKKIEKIEFISITNVLLILINTINEYEANVTIILDQFKFNYFSNWEEIESLLKQKNIKTITYNSINEKK